MLKPQLIAAVLAAAVMLSSPIARAQTVSPHQIQAQIAAGDVQTALSELHGVLQAHPNSGVAWYLTAEAQDAAGNAQAARDALAKAEQFAPGLPFANPGDVAALQAHLRQAPRPHSGIGPVLLGIIALVGLFLLLRMFFRPRRFIAPTGNYPTAYGPSAGPNPWGPVGGGGGGLGSSLLGGLAAGAGFAAGERVIDNVFGNRGAEEPKPQDSNFGGTAPGRDDGLMGDPGWDGGSQPGDDQDNFDPGNNW